MLSIVLHSGGLDSTVSLLQALKQGRTVLSLGIDYGQRNRVELEYARNQCERAGVPRKVLKIEWDKPRRDIPLGRSIAEIRSGISPAFLPGRNAVFLTLGAAEAAGIGAEELWIGVNSVDFSGYPDCRAEFIEAFQRMIDLAIPHGPKILATLLRLSKPEIAYEAYQLGLRPGDTWSCYVPGGSPEVPERCGQCDACILHDFAWREARVRLGQHGITP